MRSPKVSQPSPRPGAAPMMGDYLELSLARAERQRGQRECADLGGPQGQVVGNKVPSDTPNHAESSSSPITDAGATKARVRCRGIPAPRGGAQHTAQPLPLQMAVRGRRMLGADTGPRFTGAEVVVRPLSPTAESPWLAHHPDARFDTA